jgi:hypothetical protein
MWIWDCFDRVSLFILSWLLLLDLDYEPRVMTRTCDQIL